MADIVRGTVKPVTPVGYGYNDRKTADVDILKGQLVKITATGVALNPTSGTAPSGMALNDAPQGTLCEFTRQGEFDGFTGMTPGSRLYPSATTAGAIASDVLAATVPFIEAISATRVYFSV